MNKRQILAGTAIALLMTGGHAVAMTLPNAAMPSSASQRPLVLIQDTNEQAEPQGEDEQPRRKKKQKEENGQARSEDGGQAHSGEGGNEQPRKKRREAQSQEAAPSGDDQSGEEQPRRKRREAQSEEAAPAGEDQSGAEQPRKKRRDAEAQTQDAAPAADDQAEQPRKKKREKPATEEAGDQPASGTDDQGAERKKRQEKRKAQSEEPSPKPATETQGEQVTPKTGEAGADDQNADRKKREEKRKARSEEPSAKPATETQGEQVTPKTGDAGADDQKADRKKREERRKAQSEEQGAKPATETQGEQVTPKTGDAGENGADDQNADRKKREERRKAEGDKPAEGSPLPADAAPVLDSAKEKPRDRGGDAGGKPKTEAAAPEGNPPPPPKSDASAQKERIDPSKIEKATAEQGKRIKDPDEGRDGDRRERPEGADVVRKFGDRVIIRFGDNVSVESSDRPRLSRNAKDVYYEQLPQGREREVIERPDGSRVVTIRNKYGDVVRRSRIMTDGQEYVLNYVDERDYGRVRDWRDPGDDLPPLRLGIPANEYILDSRDVDDEDDSRYYDFLDQPPVEQIQRTYSIDEVKRSARIRDTVRRIDLDTITFAFGSAEVADNQIDKLDGVAKAMEKLLKANPAETFLIEGHTDAVGSDEANLALSDRRAESVAGALSNVFGIPPENMTTQGYGEQYLKINVQGPEARNRRVAIRRVTALVSPVASDR